ncbi:hypothetical protein N5923_24015 [Erwiniaceae bacterium BAC15a-03b]|uniref:Uncharacterized protein n=1 Tax=Winslowiella arboricola TaxID=2978220 RepID=A0A9J6PVL8_9GAMM|nr:hypothetical protein [Winslowiella arboricola]MCU5774982.1 hypothetical protein [Winslowiella arboricola]MCU5780563.1 hypothetical protein [Winslowiella arboricola]
MPLFAAFFIFDPPLFILHFALDCQIFRVAYAISGVSHRRNMHKKSIKGVFYAEGWPVPAGGAILAGLHFACNTRAGIGFFY